MQKFLSKILLSCRRMLGLSITLWTALWKANAQVQSRLHRQLKLTMPQPALRERCSGTRFQR